MPVQGTAGVVGAGAVAGTGAMFVPEWLDMCAPEPEVAGRVLPPVMPPCAGAPG
jgi:hypothetical protein